VLYKSINSFFSLISFDSFKTVRYDPTKPKEKPQTKEAKSESTAAKQVCAFSVVLVGELIHVNIISPCFG